MFKKESDKIKDKKIKISFTPCVDKEITVEELDRELETTILADTLSDKNKTKFEKQQVLNKQVEKYLLKTLDIDENTNINDIKLEMFKAKHNYLNSYQCINVKTVFGAYTLTMLGKDLYLLKNTVIAWKYSIRFMFIDILMGNIVNKYFTGIFDILWEIWLIYLFFVLLQLVVRIISILINGEYDESS